MCGNDDLASQAFRALAENRLAGKVVLVGQDADLSGCQRIVEGTQTMTVYKSVEQLAQTAAEFAAALGYTKMEEEGRISEAEILQQAKVRAKEMESLRTINDAMTYSDEPTIHEAGGAVRGGCARSAHYTIDPVAVTAENIDEVIIGSDFHTREDVYRNVTE